MDFSQLKPRTYKEADALLTAPGRLWEIDNIVTNGRKVKVWKNAPKAVRDWQLASLTKYADNGNDVFISEPRPEPAPASDRQVRTYRQVLDEALAFAGWLRESGVGVGERVAIGGRNSSKTIAAYFGTCFIGAVPVLLNTTLTGDMTVHCLSVTNPKLVITDASMATQLASIAPEIAAQGIAKLYCWDDMGHLPASVRKAITPYAASPSPQTIADIRSGKNLHIDPDADGVILFTSGTTNKPKAVLLTQRNWNQQLFSGSFTGARYATRMGVPVAMAEAMHMPPDEMRGCLLHAVPLFHVTGAGMLTRATQIGQKLVFMRKWDVDVAMELIKKEKVTNLMGVPALAAGILASPRLADDVQLENIALGGAPAPSSLPTKMNKQWSTAMVAHLYGATEAAGLLTALVGEDYFKNPTSCGLPLAILDMRVLHPTTRAVLRPNEPGVIHFKGGSILKEYLNNKKATAEVVDAEGWYNSGDVGYIDDNGFLHITDREKDLIIRGGENIPSAEIENAAHKDTRVLECAAVPVPCPIMTEQVGLAVSLVEGASATPESLKALIDPRLRSQARPVIVHVWDGPLPRNVNGKVLKDQVKTVVADRWAKQGGTVAAKAKM